MHKKTSADVQTRYARIAGFIYLLLIVLFMSGQFGISHVVGTGDFAARLERIAQGQVLYRVGLVVQLLASVFTVLLAYALYVVLEPVNARVARLALYWRLAEAFAGTASFVAFAVLGLQSDPKYTQIFGLEQIQAIVDLTKTAEFAAFNTATLFFSFGSITFYYLFLQTRYIPRALSAFGVFASFVTLLTSLGNLIVPAYANLIQFGWIPIFLAEIVTGLWLLTRDVKLPESANA